MVSVIKLHKWPRLRADEWTGVRHWRKVKVRWENGSDDNQNFDMKNLDNWEVVKWVDGDVKQQEPMGSPQKGGKAGGAGGSRAGGGDRNLSG